MRRIDPISCEPLRVWNRLEARPRKTDFRRALRAEIHDPLWMLTRQWQFGEFKGEDTGSAVFAKLALGSAFLSGYKAWNQPLWAQGNGAVPLETVAEQLPIVFDYRTRVQAGRCWLKILDAKGAEFNVSAPPVPYVPDDCRRLFVNAFRIQAPEIKATDDNSTVVEKAGVLANSAAAQFLGALAGWAFDGVDLYDAITENRLPAGLMDATKLDQARIDAAIKEFVSWFAELYNVPAGMKDAWVSERLEYRFSSELSQDGKSQGTLEAAEYYQGHLDWYAFDVGGTVPAGPIQATRKLTTIPTEARFAGMPNRRWWEFEDAAVDVGNITADTTDLAKIIVAEYALVYGNDWMVIPLKVPVGTLTEIKGILVTDVFGQRTLIEAAGKNEPGLWMQWNLFGLTRQGAGPGLDHRLLIPPATVNSQESEPVEEVRFVRDEMANLVWAIEARVPDLLGGGCDGTVSANELSKYLRALNPPAAAPGATSAALQYELATPVEENWIPFLAVHTPDKAFRSVRLQRASMPRAMNGAFLRVRPKTAILRFGIGPQGKEGLRPLLEKDSDFQSTPYYVFEEEVPRSGVSVKSSFQRTRWYDGSVALWLGRKKGGSSSVGNSGLTFDLVSSREEG